MTELTVPPTADPEKVESLVREFLEVGDEVEIRGDEMTDERLHTSGEVTGFVDRPGEAAYLEIDGAPLGRGSILYDDVESIIKVSE